MKLESIAVQNDNATNTYVVTPTPDGGFWCTCPAMRFKKDAAAKDRLCKHVEFATRELAGHYARVMGLQS